MNHKLVVITGASSGIGKSYAYKFAEKGYNLLLIARREELLKSISDDIKTKYKINAEYTVIELANAEERQKLYKKLSLLDVYVLINNAGFGLTDDFVNIEKSVEMINVHNTAVVELTHAVLPKMIEKKDGVIINVASIAGFLMSPKNAMYCATKAFLVTFTESLHIRLKNYNIKLQALCPGFTHTDFHEKIGFKKDDPVFKSFMTSDDVVNTSLKYLEKGIVICIPGFKYKFARSAAKFIPKSFFYYFVSLYSNRKK